MVTNRSKFDHNYEWRRVKFRDWAICPFISCRNAGMTYKNRLKPKVNLFSSFNINDGKMNITGPKDCVNGLKF